MEINDILKLAIIYQDNCNFLIKDAIIRKLPNGKYRVLSEKGKNLGESDSRKGAEKRLRQVEYFKHRDKNKVEDISENQKLDWIDLNNFDKAIENKLRQVEYFKHRDKNKVEDISENQKLDLTDIDDWSYSAIMRKLRQKASKEQVVSFLKIYKSYFDKAVKNKLQKPEKVALQNTVVKFNKIFKVKLDKKMVKKAALAELGDPVLVGKYLADIVRFTLNRISVEKRANAIQNLRQKLYYLNERELSDKKMPPSSAIGQSITFVKTVLFNHDPSYIRTVINNLVSNL